MLNRYLAFLTMGLCLFGCAKADADLSQQIDSAISLYDKGDYDAAIASLEEVLSKGVRNGHVYYNLAHAYYRKGEIGEAMGSFLAARTLLPRNPDVDANITFLQNKIQDRLVADLSPGAKRTVLFWLYRFSPLELWYAASMSFALCMLLIVFSKVKPRSSWPGKLGVALLVLPIFFGVSAFFAPKVSPGWGAVAVATSSVYSGPGEGNTLLFSLREGAPFAVEQRKPGWLQIRLSDGKTGWIAVKDAHFADL